MDNRALISSLSQPASRDYQARFLAYGLAAASAGLGVYTGHLPGEGVFLVIYCVIYPHLAALLQRLGQRLLRVKRKHAFLLFDFINAGALMTYLGLPVAESMVLFMILVTAAIILSGVLATLLNCLGMVLAGIAAWYVFSPPLVFHSDPVQMIVALTCMTVFILHQSWVLRQKQQYFLQLRSDARKQQKRYSELAESLSKYLSPQVRESIFSGKKSARLESQRKKLTVFFSDIKGFTELSEELEPEDLTDLLNQYLTEMSAIALKYGGTIDKFVGDSIMIFFGDPKTKGAKKDALAAVSMALEMRKHMKILRRQWRDQGIEKPLEIRMGINTGYCTVGNFGADNRMDYTLIGKEVNLASRLESLSRANQILVSHETWSLVKDIILCQPLGEARIKGFSRAIPTYRVIDFRRNLGAGQSYIEHESRGFSMYLDTSDLEEFDRQIIIKTLKAASQKLSEEESA